MRIPKGRPRPCQSRQRFSHVARDIQWAATNGPDAKAPCRSAGLWQYLYHKRPKSFWNLFPQYISEIKPLRRGPTDRSRDPLAQILRWTYLHGADAMPPHEGFRTWQQLLAKKPVTFLKLYLKYGAR